MKQGFFCGHRSFKYYLDWVGRSPEVTFLYCQHPRYSAEHELLNLTTALEVIPASSQGCLSEAETSSLLWRPTHD